MLQSVWRRARYGDPVHVTEGVFTFVALDDKGLPVEIKKT